MNRFLLTATLLTLGGCNVTEDDPTYAATIPEPVDTERTKVQSDPRRAALVQSYLNRPGTATPLSESKSAFSQKMHLFQQDYLPLDEHGLTQESTVIVRGSILDVIDGRVIDFREGESNPMVTSVLVVEVKKTIKGSVAVGETLFVEIYRSPVVSSEELNETKPDVPATLFLKAAHWNHEVRKYEVNQAIEGKELMKLRTPQGLWVAREDGTLEQPLSIDPVFTDGVERSQEEAEAEIEAVVLSEAQ